MKKRLFVAIRIGAGLLLCAGGLILAVPARAASVTALSFVEGAASANAFLVESSRLAEANGAGRRVIALAQREADRSRIVVAFAGWAAAERRAAREADFGPSFDMLGRIFGPTDRAVTIIVHDGRPVLPDLAALRGRHFDALYGASQIDALNRLVAFYVDFIKNGDDEILRALAVRDLPRARELLANAQRI